MKRIFSLLMAALLVIGFVAACGGGGESSGGEAQPAKANGEVFENDYFKATIPVGWTVFDDSKLAMMQIYPKGDTSMYRTTIHLKFEGKGNWHGTPEQSIASMASSYNGTAPEKIVINGTEYYKTTYEYSGHKQTMMVAKKDGSKITVTMVGKDYDKNPDIPKILETISYK
ncbi:hypothetical protein ACFLRT_04425 [Acidobacteriota bacterium]